MTMDKMTNGEQHLAAGIDSQKFRAERTGGLVVAQGHGRYYEAVKSGRVFIGSNAVTGVAIPIYSAKANALTLWNPTGSNYDVVLLATFIGHYSTTLVTGSLCYGYVSPAGAAAATGAPFPTATLATPVNAKIGGGYASNALFSPAVNTTTAAPTLLRTLGISFVPLTDATAAIPFTMVDWVDGSIILSPGTAIQLVGSTAVAEVATQAFMWEEVPV